MTTAYDIVAAGTLEYLTLDEWAHPDELKLTSSEVVTGIDELRRRHGAPIYPSRAEGGWARTTGSTGSQHYAVDRLSTAGDFFPGGDVLNCWLHAVAMPQWGGFGLYLDTQLSTMQPGAMMHLDLRPGSRLFWIRNEVGEYVYKHEEPAKFWNALTRVRKRRWAG